MIKKKRADRSHSTSPQHIAKRRSKPGDAPGQIIVDPSADSTTIRVIAFGCNDFFERAVKSVEELRSIIVSKQKVWIDVTGLGSESTLTALANLLGLHPLAMEDVVNVHQRAKVDEFPDSLFVVARMFDGDDAHQSEQLSFFLFEHVLLTFQERPGDCWDPMRNRIRHHRGKVCDAGLDYLLYALLDAVIDSYFPVMERLAEQVDILELAITDGLRTQQMKEIHHLRGQLLSLRKAIRPHREMINELFRDSTPHIGAEARVHLRDCYDHVIQVVESVDTYRELTSDLRDFYLSSVSNSMNEVMKVLTIISTIFMPLSFIAGVYGMNFDTESHWNMPELKWHYGYLIALGLMAIVAGGLIVYFRRRRWI
jgi:magnesium transporter